MQHHPLLLFFLEYIPHVTTTTCNFPPIYKVEINFVKNIVKLIKPELTNTISVCVLRILCILLVLTLVSVDKYKIMQVLYFQNAMQCKKCMLKCGVTNHFHGPQLFEVFFDAFILILFLTSSGPSTDLNPRPRRTLHSDREYGIENWNEVQSGMR